MYILAKSTEFCGPFNSIFPWFSLPATLFPASIHKIHRSPIVSGLERTELQCVYSEVCDVCGSCCVDGSLFLNFPHVDFLLTFMFAFVMRC